MLPSLDEQISQYSKFVLQCDNAALVQLLLVVQDSTHPDNAHFGVLVK